MNAAQNLLQDTFGYSGFRNGQDTVISQLVDGEHVLAVMPTGAGKSLCYQIPALLFDRLTIVVSPLVALMDNQVAGLRSHGVNVACIHSGQSREENVNSWKAAASGETKLMYMSPERLMTSRMLNALEKLNPAMFVIDEAHCVSKWGPAFRPEYGQLSKLYERFPDARIAAFTATADMATREDIAQQLFRSKGQIMVQGFDRPNLSLAVTPKTDRKAQLLDFMKDMQGQSGIVYALSRKNTEAFADALNTAGYKALPYHAGLDAQVRFETQERFLAEDGIVIVATIAFGMGIDKPDIRFVYHTNLPSSMEAYYQEIGRAGRDGQPAVTQLCYGTDDIRMRRSFIMNENSDDDHQRRELHRMNALLAYCEAPGCRRQVLLSYFGDDVEPCGNCDNCENPPELIDATEHFRLLTETIEQTGSRFGQAHIIDVARGANTERIRQFKHETLPAYGGAKTLDKTYLQGLIRQAIASGHIEMDIARFGGLAVTPKGTTVSLGNAAFQCTKIQKNSKSTSKARKKTAQEISLSTDDQTLLAALKNKRREISKTIGKPAFVVFTDATLMDMVQKRPGDKSQMMEVSGVGPSKYKKYGKTFLDIIADH